MIGFARVSVGAGGWPVCARCAVAAPVSYHPTAEVEAAIGDAVRSSSEPPGPNVVLGGPEPFDHPRIFDLIAACAREGAERVAVETGGAVLAAPDAARRALDAGVRHLWVVVSDADPERDDRLADRSVHSTRVFDGVTAYAAAAESAGIDVLITGIVPVCHHNLQHLPGTVARLSARGFHAVRLVSGAPLPAQAAAWIASACDTGMVNQLWVEVEDDVPTPGTHRLHRAGWPASRG